MRPRRLDHHTYSGPEQYFLTICTFKRFRLFIDGALVGDVHDRLLRTAVDNEFAILAYCYMPDHLHLLVEGLSGTANLRSFVSLAKQHSAFSTRHRVTHRLWQKGYFERVLRDEDDLFNVARYVVQNPVRAGVNARARDGPEPRRARKIDDHEKDHEGSLNSTLGSGDSAGPEITSPFGLNRDPWHGQSHVRSASFQPTMQAMWVQVAERNVMSPCSSR